jgi:ribulose-5-phosphate 4-epimerase/fuculose-1-phosphate aldolase
MTATIHAIDENLIQKARVDLAACFRWTARLNMHESIANHFSFAVSEDGSQFLCNPRGRHFSNVKASELLLLDANDADTMNRPNAPDPTTWAIHGALHRNLPHARCLMHVHSRYALTMSCLKDGNMPPIDQNTMRFFKRIAFDTGFDGMGLGDEAERLSTLLGNKKILLMGNHGLLVAGENIAQCFDDLYYFERAAQTVIDAYATGKELLLVSDEIAEKTAQQWENYGFGFAEQHLHELKEILDREEPEYRS